jgi:hypothetical protein
MPRAHRGGPDEPPRDELATIKLGGPLLSADVPIRRSFFSRLGKWFKRSALSDEILVAYLRPHVLVSADDDGTLSIYLGVVSMSTRPIDVRNVFVSQVLSGGTLLNTSAPLYAPPTEPLPPRRVTALYLRLPLGAAQIRQIVREVQPALNLRSTPSIEFAVSGYLEVAVGKRSGRVPFAVSSRQPELLLNCPAASAS